MFTLRSSQIEGLVIEKYLYVYLDSTFTNQKSQISQNLIEGILEQLIFELMKTIKLL